MSLWSNPIYQVEARRRGPLFGSDVLGWLLGRGSLIRLWRLIPVAVVGGVLAISEAALPDARIQTALEFALWSAASLATCLMALLGSAAASGRAWSEGRMDEWRLLPIDRRTLVAGQIWAWVLPLGAALTAGGAAAAVVWWAGGWAGFAAPLVSPLEGILLLADALSAVYLASAIGVWSGLRTQRAWSAVFLAVTAGSPLLVLLTGALAFAFDLGLLGVHLMTAGIAWLAANGFREAAERRLG